jgi:hypothetical protein
MGYMISSRSNLRRVKLKKKSTLKETGQKVKYKVVVVGFFFFFFVVVGKYGSIYCNLLHFSHCSCFCTYVILRWLFVPFVILQQKKKKKKR